MKKIQISTVNFMLTMLFFFCTSIGLSQTLPKIQEGGIRAPVNIKVDGKLTEWNNKLQAYNPVSRIFYTISNDDEKLYLTVRVADARTIDKITAAGIALTINHFTERKNNEKAKDPKNITIIFPIKTLMPNQKGIPVDVIQDAIYGAKSEYKNDTVNYKEQLDSLSDIANKKFMSVYKEIQVIGISEIPDPFISIYNLAGIQARAQFDGEMAFIYELSVPLGYLKLSTKDQTRFSYNLKVNGRPAVSSNGIPFPMMTKPTPEYLYTNSTTNFWGDYTLK